ncbi:MAG: Fic family protein [Armatimonadota bacterium]
MFPEGAVTTPSGESTEIEGGRWAFVPSGPPWEFDLSSRLVSLLGEASTALGALAATAEVLPSARLLTVPAIRIEAVSSSRIEGTRTSLEELLMAERDPAADEPTGDAREVVNHVQAMDWGLRNVNRRGITPQFIQALHGVLMRSVRGAVRSPGQFRDVQVYITSGPGVENLRYIPPPPSEVPQLVEVFARFVQERPPEMPVLVQVALAHWLFEAIHPFSDGNGRVGRLLMTLTLCARDVLPAPVLYLSPYIEAHRREYYDGLLAVSRDGDFSGWLEYMLQAFDTQARSATSTIRRIADVREELRERARAESRSVNLLTLLDLLFENPFVSAPRAAELMDVSDQTVRNLLETLLELGLVEEFGERKRNRVYYAPRLLRMLEEAAQSGDRIDTRSL